MAQNELDVSYDLQFIIPAYNVQEYIQSCLKSVFSQHTKYRCLVTVVNDGSTDGTGGRIRAFQETLGDTDSMRLEVIEQENRGFSGARNVALHTIKGRYITFLDSDDVLAPHAIDALLQGAEDIVQGGWYTFARNGANEPVRAHELSGFPWGKVFRAEVLKGFQFPEGYWFEDTPISFILYAMPFTQKVIPNIVYGYRLNPAGITATAGRSRRSIESYYITELCLKEFPHFGVPYDQRAYEYFLRQTRTNHRRILQQPRAIREAVFVCESFLMEQYFPGFHTADASMQPIERNLRKRQFYRYEWNLLREELAQKFDI